MIRYAIPARTAVGALLTFSLFLLAGCGDGVSRATVQGAVSLDGAPFDGGRIIFIAQDKKNGANAVADIKDGKYAVPADKGPSVGKHRVEIVWYKKTGKQIDGGDAPNLVDEQIQVLPKEYNTKSKFTEDVKSGANTFNYELKSK